MKNTMNTYNVKATAIAICEEKFGVELYFESKVSDELKRDLKALGFYLFKKNGTWCWAATQSEQTIAFANSFVPKKSHVKMSDPMKSDKFKNAKPVSKEEPKAQEKTKVAADAPKADKATSKAKAPKADKPAKGGKVETTILVQVGKKTYNVPKAIYECSVLRIIEQFECK